MALIDSNGNAVQANTYGVSPITSFSAKTTVGSGTVLDALSLRTTAIMVVSSGAGVSGGSVVLEGSLDNVSWYALGSAVSTSSASTVFTPVVVTNTPARYLRARIATAPTGGNLSASIGAAG